MRLTDRDLDILRWTYLFGCLNTQQISLLFNRWHIKDCQRRLRLLSKADYLRKIPIPTTSGRSPHLFYLGSQGASLLGVVVSKPRFTRQLTHAMKNTDILIKIKNSFDSSAVACELLPEHMMRIAGGDLIPDGCISLKKNNKQILLLIENCSGTEVIRSPSFNEDIEVKIAKHAELFKTNNTKFFSEYFDYKFNRFQLLYIANSPSRMESISEVVKIYDQWGFILLTTIRDFEKKGISENIWYAPAIKQYNISII